VDEDEQKTLKTGNQGISRRGFMKAAGTAAVGFGVTCSLPGIIWLDNAVAAIPASEGYLLVDTKKCQGCVSCMLACSLVHEGKESLSLSRIQVIQNSFEGFPDDLTLEQCRQCVDPACVEACPTGALYVDANYGNVRRVEAKKCNGCKACIEACPYAPSRSVWNPGENRAQKCDLCAHAPYHWDPRGGGPKGKQACVEVCPVGAIKFTKEIPAQEGDQGYKVNLRDRNWGSLGYPIT
jgi:protein NrfC